MVRKFKIYIFVKNTYIIVTFCTLPKSNPKNTYKNQIIRW